MMNGNISGVARRPALCVRRWCLSAILLVTPAALLAGDFLYEIRGSGLCITGYTGPGGPVAIPNTLDGYPVVAIGAFAFNGCSSLTSVSIPDSVVTIEYAAFQGCSSLASVTIPDSVVTIEFEAFAYCSSLTSVTLPDSAVTIGYAVFSGCSSLTSVSIPYSMATIKGGMFEWCSSLASVSIPYSVTNIEARAFEGCSSLMSVSIPSSMATIGNEAFAYCPNLTNATFSGNAPSIEGDIFQDSSAVTVYRLLKATGWGDYFSGRPVMLSDYTYTFQGYYGCIIITRYTGPDVNLAIPSEIKGYKVRWLGEGAFQNCSNLTSVIVPGCVAQIPPRAFQGCVNLESVTLCAPKNIELGTEAFAGCTGLTEVAFLGHAPQQVEGDVFAGSPLVTVYCQPRGLGWETTLAGRPVVRRPFNYSVSLRGEATFCGFGASSTGSLTVPGNVGRYPVTRVGGQAFLNAAGLTRITFPETLTCVGVGAFLGCSGLEEIVLPESVTAIESYAFAECTGVRRVAWGQGIKRVGVGAFSGCASLAGVTLPAQVGRVEEQTFEQCSGLTNVAFGGNAVTNIGVGAFSGCKGLTNLAIPASVTKVGSWAFSECVGLTGIEIPAAATDIGDGAFSGCARLSAITVDPANANYSSQDGVLFDRDGASLIRCPGGKSGPYAIPSGTVNLAEEAFLDCYGVTCISLPANVAHLGANVFEGCKSLTAIEVDAANASYASQEGVLFSQTLETLVRYPPGKTGSSYTVPSGVTCIADGAFEGCSGLTDIMIPAEVNTIGKNVFEGCDALESIQVNTNNGAYASQDGVLLTADRQGVIRCPPAKAGDYAVPSGITYIRDSAFCNCRRLTRITLPASLEQIGGDQRYYWPSVADSSVFAGCSELTAIDVDPANGSFHSVNGVLMGNWCCSELLYCPGGKSGAYTIPADVGYIETDAFADCSRLTAINVAASDGPYSSDDGVLYDRFKTTLLQCPGGKTGHYTVPASARLIDVAAFLNCSSLTGIAIPASVTRIEPMAFLGCSSLSSITVDPSNTVFSSQEGTLFDKTGHRLIQYACGKTDSSYTVPAGVSSLGDYSFWGRSGLANVYFKGDQPSGVGDGTFYRADQATIYYLPGSAGWGAPFFAGRPAEFLPYLYSVADDGISLSAYAGLGGSVTIPPFIEGKPVTALEGYAFFNCTSLTSVVIPEGVVSIGRSAFENCTGLTRAVIPSSVSDIGDSAFENCTQLTEAVIPKGVTRIEDGTFFNCTSLTNVVIQDCVTSIGSWAFAACDGLVSVTLPDSVSQIGDYAFGYCSGLTGVYCQGDAPRFGWSVFGGAETAAVYYLPGASGWGPSLFGVRLAAWNPRVQAGASFGSSGSGLFGFTVSGTNGMCVAVEASTNLTTAWEPVGRVTLAPSGTAVFTDADSGSHRSRFYRFRMP